MMDFVDVVFMKIYMERDVVLRGLKKKIDYSTRLEKEQRGLRRMVG
jgi:hypothetical protein